jgi:hypothetical protein
MLPKENKAVLPPFADERNVTHFLPILEKSVAFHDVDNGCSNHDIMKSMSAEWLVKQQTSSGGFHFNQHLV